MKPGVPFPWRRCLPLLAAASALAAHFAWSLRAPAPRAGGWEQVVPQVADRMALYARSGGLWMGASYAVAAAFSLFALLRWRRSVGAAAAGAAGGVVLGGAVYAASCFILGCCGSPMLAVYLGLFGGKALNAGGPLVFLLTVASTGAGAAILSRRDRCRCDRPGAERRNGRRDEG